jgi:hypothetical protein
MPEAILTATAVGRAKAKAKAKAMATLMVTAMVKEKAKSTVKAMAKARLTAKAMDRRREARFAAQVDSGASAWSRERWAARSVAEAVDSLSHRGLERLLRGRRLLRRHFAEVVR